MAEGTARLRFFHGPMSAGKSTLALQFEHNYRTAGLSCLLLCCRDRSGPGRLSSRLGLSRPALEVLPRLELAELAADHRTRGLLHPGGFLVVDEAQFLTPEQVEQLAYAVDELGVGVDAFGITTDFSSRLFPGSQRLLELADDIVRLQLEVLCWCGQPGRQNARIVAGRVTHDGNQVLVGDIDQAATGSGYRVLCRRHWRTRTAGPAA